MYFEYISLCLFWNWLIYLLPIYCCFYVSWFCFTNWKQIKGMEPFCLANVKQIMHRDFYNNSSLFSSFTFCCFSFGWWFYKKKKTGKKKRSRYLFHCIYFRVTYSVFVVVFWSDVSWSLLVKTIYSEFPNHDKSEKQSQKSSLDTSSFLSSKRLYRTRSRNRKGYAYCVLSLKKSLG